MSRATAKARTEEIVAIQARLGVLMAEARDREIWLGVGVKSWEVWLEQVELAVKVTIAPVKRPKPTRPDPARNSQVTPQWKTGGKKET